MTGTIIGLDNWKESRTEGTYKRVYFAMEDGSWAKTDIVNGYRNNKNWSGGILSVGTTLGNLKMKFKNTVDADSVPQVRNIKPLTDD